MSTEYITKTYLETGNVKLLCTDKTIILHRSEISPVVFSREQLERVRQC